MRKYPDNPQGRALEAVDFFFERMKFYLRHPEQCRMLNQKDIDFIKKHFNYEN